MALRTAGTRPSVGVMSGGLILFASLFSSDAREVRELLYQFEHPMVLERTKFTEPSPGSTILPEKKAYTKQSNWFRQHSEAQVFFRNH